MTLRVSEMNGRYQRDFVPYGSLDTENANPDTVWKNGVSRTVGFDWPVGVAVAHQQASFDAAGAPDAPT